MTAYVYMSESARRGDAMYCKALTQSATHGRRRCGVLSVLHTLLSATGHLCDNFIEMLFMGYRPARMTLTRPFSHRPSLPLRVFRHASTRTAVHPRTLSSMSASLRYLLVLDFEATCGDAVEGQNEIIEFPTILYDLKEDKVLSTFHEYVRPVIHPTLTPFCIDLTGITQVGRSSFCRDHPRM